MATKSFIGIGQNENKVLGVYCHWDGYPEWQLPLLEKDYNTLDKVKALLELGSLNRLGPQLVAFHRDKGEPYEPAFTIDLNDIPIFFDYVYIFDTISEKWSYCFNIGYKMPPLFFPN